MAKDARFTVLHYLGCDEDVGGIVSVVRALAGTERFDCVLGVNRGARQRRVPALPQREFSRVAGETLGLATWWRTRAVAREVRAWLAEDEARIFHGHSRAGLAVGLWLAAAGERRVVVSVHCYGRRTWFYRWAARRLGGRLYWLSPAMKRYYGIEQRGEAWAQCVPGCVPSLGSPAGPLPRVVGEEIRLAGVGALVEWKRWDLVLEALALLPAEVRRKVRFRHIGGADGSTASERYANALRTRTRVGQLEQTVEWRGPQPSSQALLGETDCLVVASHNEPFSVAMLEALAAGVPVLAADSGGACDVVKAGENGWLFRSGDAADLARAIVRLVETEACRTVRRTAEAELERFSAAVVAGQWREIYARLQR